MLKARPGWAVTSVDIHVIAKTEAPQDRNASVSTMKVHVILWKHNRTTARWLR